MKYHCNCWNVGEPCCHCSVADSIGECRANAGAPKCKLKRMLPPGAWLPVAIILIFFAVLFAIGGARRLFGVAS